MKLEPGQLWLARSDYPPPETVDIHWERPRPCLPNPKSWGVCLREMSLAEVRRTFGIAPRKGQAILIDTRWREWYCPTCKQWFTLPIWGFDGNFYARCPDCERRITKSRCMVIDKLALTQARKEAERE